MTDMLLLFKNSIKTIGFAIFISIFAITFFGVTEKSFGATINAVSCGQDNVQAAIDMAVGGDTVNVPAGECIWTMEDGTACSGGYTVGVCLKKGIILRGGNGGSTAVTFESGFNRGGIQIAPDAVALFENQSFDVAGFIFDGGGTTMGNEGLLSIRSNGTSIMSNIKIHDNIFRNVTNKAVVVNGAVNGVIYENIFTDVGYSVTAFGYDDEGWATFIRQYGQSDNLFIEDNQINFTKDMVDIGGTDHGQGAPGFVFRYNIFDAANTTGGWFFTIHGLQSMTTAPGFDCPSGCGYANCSPTCTGSCDETVDSCQQWSTIKSEYYRNTAINVSSIHSLIGHRGSWLMAFDNSWNGTGSTPPLRYAQYSCDSCQSPATPAYSQHVQNTYVFNNFYNGNNVPMTKGLDYCADASVGTPYAITENVDYWNYDDSFDGTAGIGIGILADRPLICTVGVGYWATDQGEWNSLDAGPDGMLYKCTAPNTWTAYYTPYAYPHPLRNEGADLTAPAAPRGLSVN